MSCETARLTVGNWGAVFTLTVKDEAGVVVDISTASTKNILFRQPDGTVEVKAGAFTTDGTDGKLKYTTVAGDLNQVGILEYGAEITTPTWHQETSRCQRAVYDRWTA